MRNKVIKLKVTLLESYYFHMNLHGKDLLEKWLKVNKYSWYSFYSKEYCVIGVIVVNDKSTKIVLTGNNALDGISS